VAGRPGNAKRGCSSGHRSVYTWLLIKPAGLILPNKTIGVILA